MMSLPRGLTGASRTAATGNLMTQSDQKSALSVAPTVSQIIATNARTRRSVEAQVLILSGDCGADSTVDVGN